MKKHLLKTLALVGITATATFADTRNHGPYIGLGAGTVVGQYTSGNLSENFGPQSWKFTMTKLNGAFDIILGYAFKVKNWNIGLELDYLFGNANDSISYSTTGNANNASAKVTSNGAWGAALRLGYQCERVLGFIRLGAENRRFKNSAVIFNPTLIPAAGARNTLVFSTNKTAFAPGVGVQVNLTKCVTGTLEYRVAFYGKISRSLLSTDAVTTSYTIKPRVSTVLASFRYHF